MSGIGFCGSLSHPYSAAGAAHVAVGAAGMNQTTHPHVLVWQDGNLIKVRNYADQEDCEDRAASGFEHEVHINQDTGAITVDP